MITREQLGEGHDSGRSGRRGGGGEINSLFQLKLCPDPFP